MFLKGVKNNILWKYMQYYTLKGELKDFVVFSLMDIRKIEPGFYRRRLTNGRIRGI